MSLIHYDLKNRLSFSSFVSTMGAQPGAWLPAEVPGVLQGVSGIYVIFNEQTNNRYIGISGNLYQRFGGRHATLVELGFARQDLARIFVDWGEISWWNSNQNPGARLVGGGNNARPFPNPLQNANPANASHPNGYGQGQCVGLVDGLQIDFEHLLMRFFMNGVGLGGTTTNTQMVNNQFMNQTANAMDVIFSWPVHVGVGASQANCNSRGAVLNAGGAW